MKNLILRYAKSKVAPAILWYDWLNVKEGTLDKRLDMAAKIHSLVKNRKATKGYLQLKALSDNVKALIKDYDGKIRAFRGQNAWTPELESLAKELANDRKLMKRLSMEANSSIETNLWEGLEEYLAQFSAEKERAKLIDLFIEGKPEDVVAYAKTLDFRKEESGLKKFLQMFPEARNIFEETSPEQYRKWVKHLERSVEDEDAFYDNWEDLLPGWDPEQATENIDLESFDTLNKSSPLYWYEQSLNRFADRLRVFK